VSLRASHLTLDLNFRGWLFSQRARFVRSIAVERVSASVRHAPSAVAKKFDWRKLEQLLPDSIRLDDLDLDVIAGATALTFRGVVLGASEIESGKFFASQIFVTSPVLRQTF